MHVMMLASKTLMPRLGGCLFLVRLLVFPLSQPMAMASTYIHLFFDTPIRSGCNHAGLHIPRAGPQRTLRH